MSSVFFLDFHLVGRSVNIPAMARVLDRLNKAEPHSPP